MRTLDHMKPEAQERIARETMEIYAPLAGRLGMQRIKSELEDLAFRYLDPENFRILSGKLHKTQKERDHYIETVSRTITSRLAEQGFACEASGRAKHVLSIHRKMKEQQCEFEQVFDTVAFRICVESVADCYAALGVMHSKWTPIPGRFKDYIALPKPNHVPIAAHHGDRPGTAADRDSNPHPRDAPRRRTRHCGALEVQGARVWRRGSEGRRALRLAARAGRIFSAT